MKKILIIGATSAIAAACARHWCKQGAEFFLVARSQRKLAETAGDLTVLGAKVHCHEMDVDNHAAYRSMIDAATAALSRFDIVLIAHGTLPDQRACEADMELMLRELATNCTSTLALLSVLAPVLESQRAGALAVITSVAGDRGRRSNYVYGSAKAAVSVFCEGLRARLAAAGVTVTDIRPGFVATPMTAGLPLPAPLVASADSVARRIVKGVDAGRDVLYAPAIWALVMLLVRNIPRFIFKRLNI